MLVDLIEIGGNELAQRHLLGLERIDEHVEVADLLRAAPDDERSRRALVADGRLEQRALGAGAAPLGTGQPGRVQLGGDQISLGVGLRCRSSEQQLFDFMVAGEQDHLSDRHVQRVVSGEQPQLLRFDGIGCLDGESPLADENELERPAA